MPFQDREGETRRNQIYNRAMDATKSQEARIACWRLTYRKPQISMKSTLCSTTARKTASGASTRAIVVIRSKNNRIRRVGHAFDSGGPCFWFWKAWGF